jgi:hypothetical protein
MNNPLQEMTQDLQNRIRELAYRMWETAGRQQGMAMEYWLKAESSVLATFAAAASSMMPGNKPAAEATPEAVAPGSTTTPGSPPAAPAETAAPTPSAPEAPAAPAAAAPAAATKPTARRASSRKAKA